MTDPAVRVRIVTDPRAQLATLVLAMAALGGVFLITRRRLYGPLIATRTARTLKRWAQIIEDRGLDMARPKEET